MLEIPDKRDVKLVALDLDGTVMCTQGKSPVSERTKQAVFALQDAGVPVTFVTGRTEDYAMPLAREFGLHTPLVTYNGARVYCPRQSRVLRESVIEPQHASAIADWLKTDDEVVACYITRDGRLHLYQSRCSGKPAHDDYLFGTPRTIVESLSVEINVDGSSVSKLIVSTQRPLETEVPDTFGPVAHVVRTHPELLEVLPVGVSKGQGVLHLCEMLEIDPAQVVAVGDQDNDISTFEICGYSVAMGDAPDHVKQAATAVTGTFEEDGCAQFLEKLL
jgi:Cof subfamily protein (haloacid dehalogenase superfamily)